jgi:hypothetical protein
MSGNRHLGFESRSLRIETPAKHGFPLGLQGFFLRPPRRVARHSTVPDRARKCTPKRPVSVSTSVRQSSRSPAHRRCQLHAQFRARGTAERESTQPPHLDRMIGRHASLADQPRAEPLGGRQVMVACRRPHSHLPLIGQPRRNSNGAQVARVLEGTAVEHGLNAIRGFFHVTRRVSFGRQESPEVSKVIREGL